MDDVELQRWLLDGDRSITERVLRDTGQAVPTSSATRDDDLIGRLLALQHDDGIWGVGVYDADDWNSTTDALWLLLELGADPHEDRVRLAVHAVHEQVRWEARNGGLPFFAGETEPCINGRVATLGAYFGYPNRALIDRLLSEQLDDGGWNCDAPPSTRSSFHSTICVLEGLLAYERTTGPAHDITHARHRGEEYLLQRELLHSTSSRRLIDETWSIPHIPAYWCYDALRGLDYLRVSGAQPDDRIAQAIDTLRAARHEDGTWHASPHPGHPVIELEPAHSPSRLTTSRALGILTWATPAH